MATITKSDELRLANRSRILTCLRGNGMLSRTSIAEITGLSGATVTLVTAELIDDGVIRQVDSTSTPSPTSNFHTRRGRPQVILELNPGAASTAVVTFLLNQVGITLYDYAGNRLHRADTPLVTATLSAETLKQSLFAAIDATLAADKHYRSALKHIALVCQGTVTHDSSALLWSPITAVRNFDLSRELRSRYSVGVTVSNDCNMIARALYQERQQQPGQAQSSFTTPPDSANNFATILLSYGIGLGFFHQGSILTGSHSSGTEFGHMLYKADGALCRCGRYGCIEAYASDYAIWRKAKNLPSDTIPADIISEEEFTGLIETAKRSPGPEREAFAEAGAAIGQGLTNLFAIFDPFPTVLVGTTALAFTLMEESLTRNSRHYGTGDSSSYVSVYNEKSEGSLIRTGASLQALSYIDQEIFGFGERLC
ncbi:hypothetical protein AB833_08535 [Chromatiales bacterium (ex Bugula neritina AB1)]|nr:hypothetical protein AB833_08535 [Chromatiales bacterium (ex Bugula neritina AB1)]